MKGQQDNKMFFAIIALAIVIVLLVTTPGWQLVLGMAPGSEGTLYAALVIVGIAAIVAYVLKS